MSISRVLCRQLANVLTDPMCYVQGIDEQVEQVSRSTYRVVPPCWHMSKVTRSKRTKQDTRVNPICSRTWLPRDNDITYITVDASDFPFLAVLDSSHRHQSYWSPPRRAWHTSGRSGVQDDRTATQGTFLLYMQRREKEGQREQRTDTCVQKPRTSIPFLPDPSKWIQTGSGSGSAPSSSTRKVAQRPLVSLRNAFATPPTTTVKRRLEPGSEAAGATRRQGSLTGFLTPPPTSSISTSQGGRGSRAVSHAKVPRVESRPRAVPLQAHRSAPVTSSSSGSGSSSPSRVRHEQEQEQGKKRSRRTLTSSPEPDPEPELEPEASGYPSTPVPDDVLDIHRRLCGRDSERMKRVISPWRAFDASAPRAASPSKSGIGGSKSKPKLKTGAARGMGVGVNKENNRKPAQVDENEKNGPKLGKRTATKILSPPPHRSPTPQKRKPKSRHPSVLSPLGSKASIRGLSPSAIYRAFKVPSISPPSHNANVQRRRSTSPGSPTPKKSKISPVSRSPLFSPPPRPLPVKAPQDDFEPVTMEAETLMTWSLGPNRAPIRPAPAPLIRDDSWDTQSVSPRWPNRSLIARLTRDHSWRLHMLPSLSQTSYLPRPAVVSAYPLENQI